MSNKIKLIVLSVLALGAVVSSGFAIHGAGSAEAQSEVIKGENIGAETSYVLREYEGYVAVFVENDPTVPMTVTSIQVSTLREFDQMLLQTGMKVQTHERLMMMLEDLGS